jgi:serine/threonine protein kinase
MQGARSDSILRVVSQPAIQADELDALVGTTLADRYRIDKLLGVGGMGAVFQARHLLLKRDVALKVLHPKLVANIDISKRFDREAQSAARLDHPNVIPVTEFGSTDDGMKYMVMQLLSGKELSEMLYNSGPLDPLRAMDLEIQILRGLEHAHDNGVIHRDLKPENVFVVKDHDGAELLKIFDFGIAKIVDEVDEETSQPLTRLGLVFGTPHYMSPEQSTGSTIDHRTDIYSAGVMLYQMLAGRLPFDHDDPVSLIRMQVTLDPPPLPDDIPPALVRVVKMMMAKVRDQRYPDARSARKALQAVQSKLAADAGVAVKRSVHDTGVVDPRDIYPEGHEALANNPNFRAGSGSGSVARAPSDSAPWDPSEISGTGSGVTSTIPPVGLDGLPRRHTTDVTGPHDMHVQQLAMAWLRAIPRKYLYAAGGFLGLLILIALLPSRSEGDDEDPAQDDDPAVVAEEREPTTTSATGLEPDGPEPDGPGPSTSKPGADEATLIEIDLALTSKNEDGALALIRPARDKFPNDAQLLWREGKALAMKKAKSSRVSALERYGEALDHDASLITNPDFYGELNALLRNSTLRTHAIDLAVQQLGTHGHKFLLELVNVDDPTEMLGWVERHRILDVLNADADAAKLVDHRLNLARDLYQVDQSPQPCAEFVKTLNAMAMALDVYYVEHVVALHSLPVAKPEAPDDAAACAGVEAKLTEVRALYYSKFPEEMAKLAAGSSSKKKKKRR